MRKRCNSNDANSMFEQAAGKLRAKLMGSGGAWPDNKSTRRAHISTPGTNGVEGAGGSGGPGCDTRGQWRGLAVLRDDAPSHTPATQHRRCGGRRWDRRAWLRCPWAAEGPGRASRSTTPSEARVWRSRGRPGPTAPETPVGQHSNTRHHLGITKPPGPNGAGRQWR